MVFDTDSFLMALDNCSSFCLTNNLRDFIGTPRKVKKDLLGIGKMRVCYEGTVMWSFEDDDGVVHDWPIPNTNYSPDIPVCLFSPQHWAQVNRDKHAYSVTDADKITLIWDGHIRTVPLNSSNVGFLHSAPGYRKSQ
jgi:hypothetical protein